jgi:hypothetical protein
MNKGMEEDESLGEPPLRFWRRRRNLRSCHNKAMEEKCE